MTSVKARWMVGGIVLTVTALHAALAAGAPLTGKVALAEQKAEEGDLTAALAALLSVEPRISNASTGMGPEKDGALRVAARIVARSDKPPFIGFPSDEEQIKWAYLQVRKQKEATPTDAGLATDFGEIASRIPTERGDAQKTLEDLEDRGAMTSSFGHAALARLRDEAGAGSAAIASAPLRALYASKRQVSLARCRKAAKRPDTCDKLLPAVLPKG